MDFGFPMLMAPMGMEGMGGGMVMSGMMPGGMPGMPGGMPGMPGGMSGMGMPPMNAFGGQSSPFGSNFK